MYNDLKALHVTRSSSGITVGSVGPQSDPKVLSDFTKGVYLFQVRV